MRGHGRPLVAVAVGLPLAPAGAAVDGPVEQRRAVQGEGRLGACQVDPLALAGSLPVDQRHENGDGHVVRAGVVHVRVAPAGRFPVRQPGGEGQPRDGLHDGTPGLEIAVGADVAEPAVRYVDDVGFDRLQLLVAEAPPFEHALGEVLADDIGDLHQLGEDLLSAPGPQVQGDAVLVCVVIVEPTPEFDTAPLVDEGRYPAQDVPAPLTHRVFDADHLGAERGQPLRCARAGQLAGEVTDAQCRQRVGQRQVP